jgi:beta-lactam-binding protein with PASTA domain
VVEDEEERPRRRAGLIVGVIALILVLLGVGAYAFSRAMGPSAPVVQQVEVPNVLTYNEAQARDRLTQLGLRATVKRENGSDETVNQITAQDPVGGTKVDTNSVVNLTLNLGPKMAEIPGDLVGSDVDDATKALDKAGFSNVTTEPASSEDSTAKENEVLTVSPDEGETAALDDKIVLTYATGESEVPILTGKTPAQAQSDAATAGFTKVKIETEETSEETAGVVFKQNPKAGTRESRSKTLTITVAVAPAPVEPSTPSPSPTPKTSDSASPSPSGKPSG